MQRIPDAAARALLRLLALLSLLILAACGAATTTPPPTSPSEATSTGADASAPTAAPPTATPEPLVASSAGQLVVWSTGDARAAQALQAAADLYVRQNPGAPIKVQPVAWEDAYTRLQAAATDGVGPDIMTGGMSWGIEFGGRGGMLDLRADYPEVAAALDQQMLPQVKAAIVPPSGELYAAQDAVDVMALFYRSDLIVQAPRTWQQLVTAIEQVQAQGHRGFAQAWGNADWIGLFNFVLSNGGAFYAPDCRAATINSPQGVQALRFYRDLYTRYRAPAEAGIDLEAGLESGEYPIGITGSWAAASLQFGRPAMAGTWEMAALPAGPAGQGTSFLGGTVIGIMAGAQHPDRAAQFIRFLYTPAAVEARSAYMQSQNTYYIPPSLELLPAARLTPDLETAYRDLLTHSAGPPNCDGWEASQAEVNRLIRAVIFDDADPQQALDQAAALMDQNLGR